MKDKVYFADEHENRIVEMDYIRMEPLNSVDVNGTITRHADVVGSMSRPKYIIPL